MLFRSAGTFDLIEMAAEIHHDNWWPDEYIMYRFYVGPESNPSILYVDQDTNGDGWLTFDELDINSYDEEGANVVQIYATASFDPGSSYLLYVQAKDGTLHRDLRTELSETLEAGVVPGSGLEIPAAQWAAEPYNTVVGEAIAVGMEALPYASVPGTPTLPSGYFVRYQFEKDGALEPAQNDNAWFDTGIVNGQIYVYRTRMLIYHTSNPNEPVIVSPFSAPVTILVQGADLTPPVPTANQDPLYPYKAQHAAAPAAVPIGSVYYNIVLAVEAEDLESLVPEDVEYRFVCSDATFSSGGSNGPMWRNWDNVAGLFEPDGVTEQVPYRYVVSTGIINRPNLVWYIYYRDRSPNQNVGDSSDGWSANGPNPVVVVTPPAN